MHLPMKAIELFAGIGGFRIALDSLSISTVWANDISSNACKVYEANFGHESIVPGDIHQFLNDIPSHDLLTGGFPCQPFSAAGKKKGIYDPRGTLFESIVDVLKRRRPARFVLENVKRLLTMENGFHFATILSSLAELDYQIEWRLINSMFLGIPQNRQRVFIVGTPRESSGQNSSVPFRLASVDEVSALRLSDRERLCSAQWPLIEEHGSRFPSWGLAIDGRFFGGDLEFTTYRQPTVPLRTVLEESPQQEFDFTDTTLKWIGKNTPVNRFVQGVEILSNQGGGARMGYTIFGIDGVAPTLTSTTSRHYERYKVNGRYRRLTNVEYARIQGFPDHHCEAVSVYDQYALYGNAVPPKMAEWVIERAIGCGSRLKVPTRKKQRRLFKDADEGRTERAPAQQS
jgi:DNA (cytosine-5)-methyltransferase 1